ncbi:MAG: DNA-directed RNA polymerase subunit H [Euryarchaeota archaeon CG01_land_8_20_14_3_00_38_12]|nr:MAG: DNA-directed RNA polymerase subunit H [Euryarchaeota archaeon CG01_land_8_20_14_3_00_38_12]PJB21672.1 MAG: DNA-directed RNA polymerase subunit H [Euryarchaeota archaeon CG_4_9_14_3_um_filter_38_12]
MKIDVTKHKLVPEHVLLSDTESKDVLKKYNVNQNNLPKILVTDPCARMLGAKPGQIVKIIRRSQTAGSFTSYRVVVEA